MRDSAIQTLTIRTMRIQDYEDVVELWHHIEGFYIRSIDDSKEGIERFLLRNPNTSVVATITIAKYTQVIGSILCGHDGRYGSLYHVCVRQEFRKQGVGTKMVAYALEALKKEQISSISLIAFSDNIIGNAFWKKQGWERRLNTNRYEFSLDSNNVTTKIISP